MPKLSTGPGVRIVAMLLWQPPQETEKKMYRVGFPGWKLAGRMGVTLLYRVNVLHDPEAGVYVATSPDLRGLVAEAPTFDELFREVHAGADELIRDQVVPARPAAIRAAWSNVAACPA